MWIRSTGWSHSPADSSSPASAQLSSLSLLPHSLPDVDPQYRPDAEQGVLRRYLSTAPGELEHQLVVGRLLAGAAWGKGQAWWDSWGWEPAGSARKGQLGA